MEQFDVKNKSDCMHPLYDRIVCVVSLEIVYH